MEESLKLKIQKYFSKYYNGFDIKLDHSYYITVNVYKKVNVED